MAKFNGTKNNKQFSSRDFFTSYQIIVVVLIIEKKLFTSLLSILKYCSDIFRSRLFVESNID